jgi:hypothetical protein
MAQVNLPRQLVVDINGSPRVGARMFLYDAGTNTLRVAYTSKSYTIQHTQPILATEGGLFPVVEVNPAGDQQRIYLGANPRRPPVRIRRRRRNAQ